MERHLLSKGRERWSRNNKVIACVPALLLDTLSTQQLDDLNLLKSNRPPGSNTSSHLTRVK